jgi:hypothetical protein
MDRKPVFGPVKKRSAQAGKTRGAKEMSQQLSRHVIDTLLDLVDNKLTAMDVIDREDTRIHSVLEVAKRELVAIRGPALPRRTLRPRNSIRPMHPAANAAVQAA